MGIINNIWRRITHSKALDQASGPLEMDFFEDIYRLVYAIGLSNEDHTVQYTIYSTVVKLMLAMVLCGEIWYAISDAVGLDEVASCINVIVIQSLAVYKYKNMSDQRETYKKLAKSMDNTFFDTNTEERAQLVKYWANTHSRYVKLLLGLGNCTMATWHLYPLIDEIDYNLMIGIHLPFHYATPYRYPIIYVFVGIAFSYIAEFVMLAELVLQAHLVPLICHMSVLGNCFNNIVSDCQEGIEGILSRDMTLNNEFIRKYLTRLGILVEQHKLILKYSLDLRAILSTPLLGQMAASGILICFVGYEVMTSTIENITKCLMSMFYLGYNLCGIFMLCRWCEEITNQSQNIGEMVYCSGWESGLSMLPGVRATILQIIIRANKPLIFTAGGMYNLSLNAFTTLVKTSYSALTVLLRFRHD